MAILADRMTFDAPRRTKDGYLAVRAHAARAGIYDYLGAEVDPSGSKFKPNDTVRVYRPEDEVFDERSVRSFIMRPITNDHPTEAVTADNWAQHAKGVVAGAIRDGDHLAFDLVFMDAATIRDVEAGKRELSNGYAVDISIEDGTTPDGQPYQAVQRSITGNHVALVDRGRAGPSCAIPACDAAPQDIKRLLDKGDRGQMKTIMIDGHSVEVSDAAEIAVKNLLDRAAKLDADLTAANTKVGELTATVSTKDGEIAALKKQVEDATVSPEKLDAMVASREAVIADARKIVADIDGKGKTEAAIRKEAVLAKLGDTAKDMDDNAILGAFTALAASVVDDGSSKLADGVGKIVPTNSNKILADAQAGYVARLTRQKSA